MARAPLARRRCFDLRRVVYAALALAACSNSYYQLMMTLVLVWACFGLSWNLLSGYSGLVSFGHAAFFGLGAYTDALGQSTSTCRPGSDPARGRARRRSPASLIGLPTFRLRGHYFALAMLAYPLAHALRVRVARLPGSLAADEARGAGRLHAVRRSAASTR